MGCELAILQEIVMDRDVLVHRMTERFTALFSQALDALDKASDGHWIADSEWAFRDAFQQLLTESHEAAVQDKVDAHPTAAAAAFSPSGPGARRPATDAQQG